MNNFSEEIKRRFGIKELDTKTMIHRFNSFVSACHMNLNSGLWHEKNSDYTYPHICMVSEEKNHEYNINFSSNYETGNGRVLILIGKYNDLSLFLINYVDRDIKFKINELPYKIKLKKTNNLLEIECDNYKSLCRFSITSNNQTMVFYGNINYDDVMKIVDAFVTNPEYLFDKYKNVIVRKRIDFTQDELKEGMINRDNEPTKTKKR